MKPVQVVLSCEHAGPGIPDFLEELRPHLEPYLFTHRGFDFGAKSMTEAFAKALGVPGKMQEVTRMVIDCNRSLHHPKVFSEVTRNLDEATREAIHTRVYRPHREAVRASIEAALEGAEKVLHLAVHSFAPVVDGVERRAEVGLLYDPAHPGERDFASLWRSELKARCPSWRVRRNYPFRGAADGFPTALRRVFGPRYLGFELESNRVLSQAPEAEWATTKRHHTEAFSRALERAFAFPGS